MHQAGKSQAGIFQQDGRHHVFLEFDCLDGMRGLPGRQLLTHEGSQVIAFGKRLTDSLESISSPPGLRDFTAVKGTWELSAPATQHDIFIWLQGNERDELFATALAWCEVFGLIADLAAENHGFVFRDSRDLTGFVDGSGNPKGDARMETALINAGEHAGGSFVLAQRWVHDLAAFGKLQVAEQEHVIGRTKPDSVELAPHIMPRDAHVARTDLPDAKIYRRSTPVGGVRDPGLFFLAFSADADRYRVLLESMYGLAEDGCHDRLLVYTTPISGSFYYAPPVASLAAVFEG